MCLLCDHPLTATKKGDFIQLGDKPHKVLSVKKTKNVKGERVIVDLGAQTLIVIKMGGRLKLLKLARVGTRDAIIKTATSAKYQGTIYRKLERADWYTPDSVRSHMTVYGSGRQLLVVDFTYGTSETVVFLGTEVSREEVWRILPGCKGK